MQSVFTINPIVVPKPSESHCGRGFPRLTRPSLQSFLPDAFCKAESRITRTEEDFQRLTRLSLQSLGYRSLTCIFECFYCGSVDDYGCFLRNGGGSDGIPSGTHDQDAFHANELFVKDAVDGTTDLF
jgi:hypothetical protein